MEESMVTFYLLDYPYLLNYYLCGFLKKTIDILSTYSEKIKNAEYYSNKYTSAVQPSIQPVQEARSN